MRTLLLVLFLPFALAAAQCCGQMPGPGPGQPIPLAIQGPVKADPYRLVELVALGDLSERALIWDVSPEDAADVREMPNGKLVFVAPPGTYRIKLRAIRVKDGVVSAETARHSLTISSPIPVSPPATVPPAKPSPATGDRSKIDPLKALSQIRFPTAKKGVYSGCTATVMYPQLPDGRYEILTAAHCVASANAKGELTTRDRGQTLRVTVASIDRRCDLCWLLTDEPVEPLYCAVLAKENPAFGTRVWHSGYGVDRPENREDGQVKGGEDSIGRLTFYLPVSQGDSGGGIIRSDNGEVVSAVCCVPSLNPNLETYGGSCRQAWRLRPSEAGKASAFSPAPGFGGGLVVPGDCPGGFCPLR